MTESPLRLYSPEEARQLFDLVGISQEMAARILGKSADTIGRWLRANHEPTHKDNAEVWQRFLSVLAELAWRNGLVGLSPEAESEVTDNEVSSETSRESDNEEKVEVGQ